MKNLRHVYVCTLEVSAPGGSGNLGVHQILTGLCEPGSKFDAMSFQQNFLECNCSTLFPLLFMRSRELKDEINLKVSNRRGVLTLSSCQWIPDKPLIASDRLGPAPSLHRLGCASQCLRRILFFTGFVGHLARAILEAPFAAPLAAKSIRFARTEVGHSLCVSRGGLRLLGRGPIGRTPHC